MIKKILPFLFLLITLSLFSNTETDSLRNYLLTAKDTNKVKALLKLSRILETSDLEKAYSTLYDALKYSREIHYEKGEIDALIGLAVISNYQSKSSKADSFLQAALPIALKSGNRSLEGNIYNNMGMSYYDKFDYQKSLQYYLRALTIFEELNQENKYTSTLNNIANLYYTLKQYDKALNYHFQSLSISKRLGEKTKVASSLYNMGLVYLDKGDPLKALGYFQQSLELAKLLNHKVGQAMLYNSVGKCYRLLRDYEKALEYSNHALEMKKEQGDENGIANLHNNIAEIYLEMRQYDKAIEYSESALEKGKKLKSRGIMQNAYQTLSLNYSAQKKYELAYKSHLLYVECKDSLFDAEKSKQLTEMQTKYETEKKDKDLIKKDAEIKFQEAATHQKETQRNAFIFGFIIVGFLALLIFKGLQDKRKANKKLTLAYEEIDYKNQLVEEKNKSITDSINYAKRIQSALLASENLLQKNLSSYFILYKPKDIVSGDFYWAHGVGNSVFLICTGDCTGHGVPGAFMSLLAASLLNEIVIEKNVSQTSSVLNSLRDKLIKVLNPEGSAMQSYEGMDCSLCKFDFKKMEMEISSANNSVIHVSEEKVMMEYKADKQPVGFHPDPLPFSSRVLKLKKNDIIYTMTDGFADQFGGPKGKKFKKKHLQELLLSVSDQPMDQQKQKLLEVFEEWKGKLEQIDDILIIGIKVS
jgi:serine phosphatase RsbU (regulator of sigma subunit)